VALYEVLERMQPTAIVRLNRAVALRYAGSVGAALALLLEESLADSLAEYPAYHAALAECRSVRGESARAAQGWRLAAELTENQAARDWLLARAREAAKESIA
jgi:RNA polymerase sigma-70 factor (ECF subfamily)